MAPRLMSSKKSGICEQCQQGFPIGEPIYYSFDDSSKTSHVWHQGCYLHIPVETPQTHLPDVHGVQDVYDSLEALHTGVSHDMMLLRTAMQAQLDMQMSVRIILERIESGQKTLIIQGGK